MEPVESRAYALRFVDRVEVAYPSEREAIRSLVWSAALATGRVRLPVQGAPRPRPRRRPGSRTCGRDDDQRPAPQEGSVNGEDCPGRREGLTDREAEILALITQGKGNAEVAAHTYLSPDTVKSYIHTIYR